MKSIYLICLLFAAALARKGFGPTDQEWGFVTVREKAHMFWWLHYTTADVNKVTERPLVIWLQGGPGSASTGFGNFAELGPLDADLNLRNTSWTNDVNVLFVDNPVGTGYSYVDSNEALTITNRQIAEDFAVLLKGFYDTLPIFKDVPLYIFCESYGGKMTAEIALVLFQEIEKGNIESNFKGVGLGDSWISPIDSVLSWAPYLLNIGAVDQKGYEAISEVAEKTRVALEAKQFLDATRYWGETEGAVARNTYGVDFYNILTKIRGRGASKINAGQLQKPELRDATDDKIEKLMNGAVKEALDITTAWGSSGGLVFNYLQGDFMKPVTHIVEELLNTTNIKVAVYNGQLDLIVDTPGTIKWVDNLQWPGRAQWNKAERHGFTVNNYYEGNVKKVGNLAFYWVDRAGHMVPSDNPAAMIYILKDVTNNFEV